MKQAHLIGLLLVGILSGCDQSEKPTSTRAYKDAPERHSKENKTAEADALFLKGNFKKSSGMEW